MKKLLIFITAFVLNAGVFAQNEGMMNNQNSHNNGNYSFSPIEMILGVILLVLVIGGMMYFLNNNRRTAK